MAQRLIDPDVVISPLKEEYKKVKQAFDETSVFQAPNDVALYGALMQELGAVIGMIEDANTIEAKPVKHGRWLPENRTMDAYWVCSCCGFPSEAHGAFKIYNYCPNCGAYMKGTEDD